MKNNNLFILFALSLSLFLFTSCDTLWSVGDSTDISFNLNLDKYLKTSTNNNVRSIGVVPDGDAFGDDDDELSVVVSLYDDYDESLLDSKTLSLKDAQETNVVFEKQKIGKTVYAVIEVVETDKDYSDEPIPFVFRAATLKTRLRKGDNSLIAKPNAIFYYPNNGGTYVVDSDDYVIEKENYQSAPRRYETVLQDAYDAMSIGGQIIPNATVYVMGILSIGINVSDETWDFPGLTLMRGSKNSVELLIVNAQGKVITLKNIIFDGNRNRGIFAEGPLLEVGYGTVTLDDGAILQNNYNISDTNTSGGVSVASGAVLKLEGGSIQYNKTLFSAGGINAGGTIDINSGKIANNEGDTGGVELAATGSSLNMLGGAIEYNEGATYGGIYIAENRTVTISGGSITENISYKNGGGIYISEEATLNLSNVTITENKAALNGAGIYAVPSSIPNETEINVSGAPIIINNNKLTGDINNFYLSNNIINVTGPLTGNAGSIGIFAQRGDRFAEKPVGNFTSEEAKIFSSDLGYTIGSKLYSEDSLFIQ